MRIRNSLLIILVVISILALGCDDSSDDPLLSPEPAITPAPTPEPTPIPPPKPELELSLGQVFNYGMIINEEEFGNSQFEVIAKDIEEESTVYTIQADLEMAATCPTTPTTGDATLQLDKFGMPISYMGNFSVGQG